MLRLLLLLTSAGNCAASVPPSKEECADLVGILQDGSGKLPPTWGDAIDRLRQTCAKFQSDGFCDDVLHAVVRGYEDKEAAALFEADAMLCDRVSVVKHEALAYSRTEEATRQTNQAWVEETLKQRLINAMIQRSSAEYDPSQKEGFLARGQGHRMQAAVSVDSSFTKKRSPTEAPTEAPTSPTPAVPTPAVSPPAPSPSSPPSPASQPSGCSGGDGAPCYVNGCGGCNGGLSCHKKSGAWNVCLPDSWPCKEHLPDWNCSVVGGNSPTPAVSPPTPAPMPPAPDAGCAGDAAPCYSRGNGGCCATYSTPQWTIPLTCYEKFPGFNVCMKTGNCNGHSDFTCKVIGSTTP